MRPPQWSAATERVLPAGSLRTRRPREFRRFGWSLGQHGLARVDDLGVGEDVDEGRPAGGEGALQGGTELVGALDQLRVAAERPCDLVVAGSGAELGGEGVAVEEAHRVV